MTQKLDPAIAAVAYLATAFVLGVVSTLTLQRMAASESLQEESSSNNDKIDELQHKKYAGATIENDDLSLFYGNTSSDRPNSAEIGKLTTIHDRCKFLPNDLYAHIVQDTVVCCVDILLVRWNGQKRQALLVKRSAQPAKGFWWLPGGRLLKGETFFDCAVRKAHQETGISSNNKDGTTIKPVQVLGVWNTFFPYSSWDKADSDDIKGTQTVNPIVLVEINTRDSSKNIEIKLDNQSEESRFIDLDPVQAENNGEDRYVLQALYRLQAWSADYATTPPVF